MHMNDIMQARQTSKITIERVILHASVCCFCLEFYCNIIETYFFFFIKNIFLVLMPFLGDKLATGDCDANHLAVNDECKESPVCLDLGSGDALS